MFWHMLHFDHLPAFHFKYSKRCSLYLSTVVLLCVYAFQGPASVQASTVAPSDRLITRLMNGGALAGRVEVYYNGGWTTICDDGWDDFDATVVCKQMGFRSGQAWDAAYYGQGTGDIAFKNVACTGQETNLGQCFMPQGKGDFSSSCTHAEDAGVQCFAGDLDITPIRLRGGNSSAGRVEVYHSGTWGTVCDSGWDDADAAVVCRALGMAGGTAQTGSTYGAGSGAVWLNGSVCVGTEAALTECIGNVFQQATGDCATHTRDAGVSCGAEIPTLRLAGSTSTSGRVEVYHDGQWGTVCDNGWDSNDAKVVCRQLGLTGGVPRFFALYGQGSGPIWLTDLTCSGQEDKITSTSCMSSFNWGDFSDICNHGQDAGVDCSEPSAATTLSSLNGLIHAHGLIGAPGPGTITVPAVGDVSLTDIPSGGALVKVYNGTWGTFCGQGWDMAEGKVVCQQAGYTDVNSVGRNGDYSQGSHIANIRELNCAGDEGSLLECDMLQGSNCSHSDDAWVKCIADRFNAGNVQLVKSSDKLSRIRIFRNNEWNFICGGNDWTENVAKVVCTDTSGVGSTVIKFTSGQFDTGTSRLRSVSCTGGETSLRDCGISLMSRAMCPEYALIQCLAPTSASTQSSINIVAIIVPIALVIMIVAIIVGVVLTCKHKKGKLAPVYETKEPSPREDLEEPAEVKVTQSKMEKKVVVPRLELKTITESDDAISHHSRKSLAPLGQIGEPLGRIGAPLSARDQRESVGHRSGDLREPLSARGLGDPLSRSRHSHLLPALDGGRKLPPLSMGRTLPPLKPLGGASTQLSFTARSEGSTLSPRAAWREQGGGGIPPPASYSELDLDKPKKKKKRRGGGILKNNKTDIYED